MEIRRKRNVKRPPYPLTNIETQKYYQNEPKFTGVYSRDNLPNKIKDKAYVINLDDDADVETNWIALYVLNIEIIYFDSFGAEHVPKEIKKFIKHKNIKTNCASKCAACSNKKSRFIKEQEAKGFLSSLGIKIPLGNSPLIVHY